LLLKRNKTNTLHHKSRGFKEKYDKEAQELALKKLDRGGLNHVSG
jgi:hypothetical protein